MNYILETMNPEHANDFKQIVEEIRAESKIPETEVSTSAFNRFCQSQAYDFKKGKSQIQKHLEWRKKYNFKEAAKNEPETLKEVSKFVKVGIYGTSYDGYPIGYIKPLTTDVYEAFNELGPTKITEYQIQMFERLSNIVFPACTEKAKKNIDKIICVVDLKDVQFYNAIFSLKTYAYIQNNFSMYRDNFPEMNKETLIINSCLLTRLLFNVIKSAFQETTLKKLKFYDSDYQDRLRQLTSNENIPKEYGGKGIYELDKYPNFFSKELEESIAEKRTQAKK